MSFDKIDKWTIVDIGEDDVPNTLLETLYANTSYADTSHEGEDLIGFSRVLELLDGSADVELSEEETTFLIRLKEIMEESDSFYFRIRTN